MTLYEKLKFHYESVKPIRGWNYDARPFLSRRRQHELVTKRGGMVAGTLPTYGAKLYETHVVEVDYISDALSRVTIDLSYLSQTTIKFVNLVMGTMGISISVAKRFNRGWAGAYIQGVNEPGAYTWVPVDYTVAFDVNEHCVVRAIHNQPTYVRRYANRQARQPVHAAATRADELLESILALTQGTLSDEAIEHYLALEIHTATTYGSRYTDALVRAHNENNTDALIGLSLRRGYGNYVPPTAKERVERLLDYMPEYNTYKPLKLSEMLAPHKDISILRDA